MSKFHIFQEMDKGKHGLGYRSQTSSMDNLFDDSSAGDFLFRFSDN